jgi:hypothetical protein
VAEPASELAPQAACSVRRTAGKHDEGRSLMAVAVTMIDLVARCPTPVVMPVRTVPNDQSSRARHAASPSTRDQILRIGTFANADSRHRRYNTRAARQTIGNDPGKRPACTATHLHHARQM